VDGIGTEQLTEAAHEIFLERHPEAARPQSHRLPVAVVPFNIDRRRAGVAGAKPGHGAHRISRAAPDYPDAKAFHQALVAENPDRLVWGGDWPHPRMEEEMPDVGHLLDLFTAWTPDAAIRRRILVTNPQRLYGFPAA